MSTNMNPNLEKDILKISDKLSSGVEAHTLEFIVRKKIDELKKKAPPKPDPQQLDLFNN